MCSLYNLDPAFKLVYIANNWMPFATTCSWYCVPRDQVTSQCHEVLYAHVENIPIRGVCGSLVLGRRSWYIGHITSEPIATRWIATSFMDYRIGLIYTGLIYRGFIYMWYINPHFIPSFNSYRHLISPFLTLHSSFPTHRGGCKTHTHTKTTPKH